MKLLLAAKIYAQYQSELDYDCDQDGHYQCSRSVSEIIESDYDIPESAQCEIEEIVEDMINKNTTGEA